MAAKVMKTLLKVVKGKDQGREFLLYDDEQYGVGRAPDARIKLSDPTVSHEHARMESTGGIWFVVDLGSRHGTSVNKERINGRKALFDRDTVRVGKTLFEFREFEQLDQEVIDEANIGFKPKGE